MVAKYINEHRIETAKPQMFQYDGTTYFGGTVPDEALLANGWLPLVEAEEPEIRAGFHAEPRYIVGDGAIVKAWEYVEDQPPAAKQYSKLKLYCALASAGLWDTLKAWMQGQTLPNGINVYEAYQQAQVLATDNELFAPYLSAAKQALGVSDEAVAAILASAEAE